MNQNERIISRIITRVILSIFIFFGVLTFAIICVGILITSNLLQKIMIIIVGLFAEIAVLGTIWAYWNIMS